MVLIVFAECFDFVHDVFPVEEFPGVHLDRFEVPVWLP